MYPVIAGCFFEGRRYRNGHVWPADECRKCVCRHGDVKCSTKSCPPLYCATKPQKKPGECCPVCPKDLGKNVNCHMCGTSIPCPFCIFRCKLGNGIVVLKHQ